MGGVAGHLSHLHENLDFTFGDIKGILENIANANIDVIEKVDGQNLFFTYNAKSKQIRTARNNSDIKKGGMTPEEFASKWRNHPAENAFTEGFQAIRQGVSHLSHNELVEIFGKEVNNYVNAEIMFVDNPNIINYGGNYIVLHNLHQFDSDGKSTITSRGPFQHLVDLVENADDELTTGSWATSGPRSVDLKRLTDDKHYSNLVSSIDALGMSDSSTLGDYTEQQLRRGPVSNLAIPVVEQEGLIKLILGKEGSVSLRDLKKGKTKEAQKLISAIATKTNSKKIISKMLAPVERIISDFAIEVLRGMSSFFVSDHDAEIMRMKEELTDAIEKIRSAQGSDAEKLGEMLEKQLGKLGSHENVASTLEGVVFEYPVGSEILYKLTGTFAMVNQIIGRARRMKESVNPSLSEYLLFR